MMFTLEVSDHIVFCLLFIFFMENVIFNPLTPWPIEFRLFKILRLIYSQLNVMKSVDT
jgi:hypothetical protein